MIIIIVINCTITATEYRQYVFMQHKNNVPILIIYSVTISYFSSFILNFIIKSDFSSLYQYPNNILFDYSI